MDLKDPAYLLREADRWRAVAKITPDEKKRAILLRMAKDYEDRAKALSSKA